MVNKPELPNRARPANSTPARPWYRIQNKAEDGVAQIDIYDEIHWFWGINAADFRRDLLALGEGIKTIEVHVNSPGGDVYEAIAIMNTLRQHEARVVTIVDGLAASSAGFIAVGASDELIMAPNSELMAHLPWSYARGNAADLRKTADDLDRIASNIASIFATRTATPSRTGCRFSPMKPGGLHRKPLTQGWRTGCWRPNPVSRTPRRRRTDSICLSSITRDAVSPRRLRGLPRVHKPLSLPRPRSTEERSPLWQP